ncbi:MAG: DNA mismatch repair endonuclease MutL, partial [Oscillospiraceae bacterium]|nr:DNA mismatch repair endonuclease MutL [Oscillospiraceae bacterium]
VEIKKGGLTYIRVSDNGCGISREDVPRAFLRHATSKLRSEADLEAILTLGFRGEALAATGSVSRIELLTRTDEEDEGTAAVLEGGELRSVTAAARPRGTTVTVRDLFFNTPARLKFMKSDRAEAANVSAAVTRLALSRPDISLRYIRDGSGELHTPGDGRLDSCVYAALGRDFSAGMLPVDLEGDGARARGFISKVSALRGNRNHQFFFVNGRCVRSRTLQAALEQAYRNRMFTGRFPACVLYIETGASKLDVNVHPAKTEIKFLFEKSVFDAVHYGALAALDADPEPQALARAALPSVGAEPGAERDGVFPPNGDEPGEPAGESERRPLRAAPSGGRSYDRLYAERRPESFSPSSEVRSPAVSPYVPSRREGFAGEGGKDSYDEYGGARQTEMTSFTSAPGYRVVGEALGTYIIVETGGALWLIDKHAAHERVHFDRLRGEGYRPMMQSLIEPVVISPGDAEAELLLDNAEMLEALGFSAEPFGGGRVAVRRIPADIDIGDVEGALSEICEEFSRGGDTSRRRDAILASVACKAAIKAGRDSGERELYELAGRVVSGEVRHCPHGRPVATELTKAFIDRSFKRI